MFNFAKKRINRLTEKAKAGDLMAQCELGTNYIKGIDIDVDTAQGWYWLSKSAEGGFAEAEARMAALILRDFPNDRKKLEEAFAFAKKSAEQRCGFGLAMLARFYGDGIVVEDDIDKALELYKIAYALGYKKARTAIDRIETYKLRKQFPSLYR